MKRIKHMARWVATPVLLLLTVLLVLLAPAGVLMAATTLTFTATTTITWQYSQAVTGVTSSSANNNSLTATLSTTNGTGAAGTANLIYFTQATIAASGNTNLDAASGLNDFFGNALVFARVKVLFIQNSNATTASSITLGNATHPLPIWGIAGTTPTLSVLNGGYICGGDTGATGMVVGSGLTDTIKIVNADGANSATVNVVMVGSTA